MKRQLGRMKQGIVATLASWLALASPSLAAARPALVIPLEPYADEHWAFRATINGRPALMVFDTGGGLTAITPQTAQALGCRPWGRLTGFRMRGDRIDAPRCDKASFEVAGRTFSFPAVGVWDFNAMLPNGAPPIAANVGLDMFRGRMITLDIPHRRLILETPDSFRERTVTATEAPIHLASEVEGYATTAFLGVQTPDGPVWMELDSGNDAPITVGDHVARALGLDPARKAAQAADLQVAPGLSIQGPAHVRSLIYDGNIGAPVINGWIVSLDLMRGRAWIRPAASAQSVPGGERG